MQRRILNTVVKGSLAVWYLLTANTTFAYTHADTLRGSNGRGRAWWDVLHYNLKVSIDTNTRSIAGSVIINFKITDRPADSMQIDLQQPLEMDSILRSGHPVKYTREGNVIWVSCPFAEWKTGTEQKLVCYYHGKPRKARNPPWDGGFSWTTDSSGKSWVAVSCQGLGASVWWPCKDAQWDEPDNGMDITIGANGNFSIISNGRLADTSTEGPFHFWHWRVVNPINNYDVTFYLGDYVHWHDTLMGEKGALDLDYWVLRNNEERARRQFAVVKPMIHCFEYWMGPYPFYEDGYKLVEAPYLGMEHQGAIAYGNHYQMGYLGTDRSGSDVGMKFDYIIIHESGHEWFGNNVTARDIADNWIHEGITTYSESLFAECMFGKDAAGKFCKGERRNIMNFKPVISDYGVNEEGSPDMYDKGAAIMYMIRSLTGNDERFRKMLRGLGTEFYHQVVTTGQVERYIAKNTGLNLDAFFNQYLRTTDIPEFEYYIRDGKIFYRFNHIVDGFTLPVAIHGDGDEAVVKPTSAWQSLRWDGGYNVRCDNDFLIRVK